MSIIDSKALLWLKNILYNRNFDNNEINQYIRDHFEQNIFIPNSSDKVFLEFLKIIEQAKKILIIGDYDADGIISTSILTIALKALSKDVDFYLPNRYTDGYGLNINTLRSINSKYRLKNYDLIITIDNGISSIKEIEYLVNNGIKVIVIDHHTLPPALPKANLIIHPFLIDLKYRYLCASGIAYKVGIFLLNYSKDSSKYELERDILYLAGIGTLADIVPLLDENRRIAKSMLNLSKSNYMPFVLKKLWEKIGYKNIPISSFDFSFILIPRINAPGRISSPNIIFEFILSNYININNNEDLIIQKIQEIEKINKYRQKLQEKLYQKIISNIYKNNYHKNEFIIPDYVEDDINYLGVMGIVAGKIANEFNKPCAIFVKLNDTLKGSVRNPIDDINITDIFLNITKTNESIIKKYGGHSKAAGIELNLNQFNNFRNLANLKLIQFYQKSNINPNLKKDSKVAINIPFYFFDDFLSNLNNINEIMEPYGEKNEKPSIKIPLTNSLLNYLINLKNGKNSLILRTFQNKEIHLNINDYNHFYKELKNIKTNENNSYIYLKLRSVNNNKYVFDLIDILEIKNKPKNIVLELSNFLTNFIFFKEIFFINVNFRSNQNFINFINSFNKFYIILDEFIMENEQIYDYLNQHYSKDRIYFVKDIEDFKKIVFYISNENISLSELSTLYINDKVYKGFLIILLTDKSKTFYEFLKNNKEILNINFNLILLNSKII
ncbi:MAG: single-stranded-DNA-specific exonuclease RecJ [bacterium]